MSRNRSKSRSSGTSNNVGAQRETGSQFSQNRGTSANTGFFSNTGTSSRSGTSTTNRSGFSQVDPFSSDSLDAVFGGGRARGIFDDAVKSRFPTGNLTVPFAQQSQQAFDMIENAAGSANPVVQSAAAANRGLTDGSNRFLASIASNPNRQAYFDMGAERLADRTRAEFAGSGMVGGDRHQLAFGRGMGDYTSRFQHDAYATDQQNALRAAGIQSDAASRAGQVAQNLGIPGQMMRAVGQAIEDRGQRDIDANIRRDLYNQNRPLTVMSQYLSAIAPVNEAFGKRRSSDTSRTNFSENTRTFDRGRTSDFGRTSNTGRSVFDSLTNNRANARQTGTTDGRQTGFQFNPYGGYF